MYDIEDINIFVRVADLGNLSAAGRELRLSAAVVSNRIARLEKRLGVRLLNRTTRRVGMTREGEIYYSYCIRILDQVEQAESAIAAQRDVPRGPLLVTAPNAYGRQRIAPLIPDFAAEYPDIQVRLHLTDRIVDLLEEKIDLAIRIADLKDSTAIVRKLSSDERLICAAPDYLAAHGTPQSADDLLDHNCLLLRFPGSQQFQWTLNTADGPKTISVSGNMDSDDSQVLTNWCLAGHGLSLKSRFEVADYLESGELVAVLPDAPPHSPDVSALYPHGHFLPPRVRALIDFLADHL